MIEFNSRTIQLVKIGFLRSKLVNISVVKVKIVQLIGNQIIALTMMIINSLNTICNNALNSIRISLKICTENFKKIKV